MNYEDTVKGLTPEMVAKLKTAIELGKWDSGEKLTETQRESAMQAVILWQAQNVGNQQNEPFVVDSNGEMFTGKGESHKLNLAPEIDEDSIIVKTKL